MHFILTQNRELLNVFPLFSYDFEILTMTLIFENDSLYNFILHSIDLQIQNEIHCQCHVYANPHSYFTSCPQLLPNCRPIKMHDIDFIFHNKMQ